MDKSEKFMRAVTPVIYGGLSGQSTIHLADALVKDLGISHIALYSFAAFGSMILGIALSFKYQREGG